jgi:hypothetical protein
MMGSRTLDAASSSSMGVYREREGEGERREWRGIGGVRGGRGDG